MPPSFSRAKSHENLTPMNHVTRARFATSNSYWEESIMCSDIEMFLQCEPSWVCLRSILIMNIYENLWSWGARGSVQTSHASFLLCSISLVSQSGFVIARKLLISIFRMLKHPLERNLSVENSPNASPPQKCQLIYIQFNCLWLFCLRSEVAVILLNTRATR